MVQDRSSDQIKLEHMICNHAFLMDVLKKLQHIAPQTYLSAGVIRNWIWSEIHEQNYVFEHTEIDIIFYDPDDHNDQKAQEIKRKLEVLFPTNTWDVTNQAWVHLWYKTSSGAQISPLQSIAQALSYWPETATAIAVRLNDQNQLDVVAPFGLNDLFDLKLRWNGTLVSHDVFLQRIQSKRFLQRWPKLKLID